jgi:hypothetical protein
LEGLTNGVIRLEWFSHGGHGGHGGFLGWAIDR